MIYQKMESEKSKNQTELNLSKIKKRRRHTPGIIPSIIADSNTCDLFANCEAGAKLRRDDHPPPPQIYDVGT